MSDLSGFYQSQWCKDFGYRGILPYMIEDNIHNGSTRFKAPRVEKNGRIIIEEDYEVINGRDRDVPTSHNRIYDEWGRLHKEQTIEDYRHNIDSLSNRGKIVITDKNHLNHLNKPDDGLALYLPHLTTSEELADLFIKERAKAFARKAGTYSQTLGLAPDPFSATAKFLKRSKPVL